MGTIVPCCSSAIHHAWRLHSRLHLGRKCRLEKVALVVRRSEAAGWRWSSSTLNECKPRFLGVAVMHWARPMAAELRDSRSERRQGLLEATAVVRSDKLYESAPRIRLGDRKTRPGSWYPAMAFGCVLCPLLSGGSARRKVGKLTLKDEKGGASWDPSGAHS